MVAAALVCQQPDATLNEVHNSANAGVVQLVGRIAGHVIVVMESGEEVDRGNVSRSEAGVIGSAGCNAGRPHRNVVLSREPLDQLAMLVGRRANLHDHASTS